MTRFDAIVVGAGPAGATAARELAAGGARVLIVDREAFPRYKTCAGGLPRRTRALLPFPIDGVVEESVHLFDVSIREGVRFVRDSGAPFLDMVMRDRFDALLLEQACRAGAEFRGSTRVSAVEEGPEGARIVADGFAAESSFLIGADGANSVVARQTGLGAGLAGCAAWEMEIRLPGDRRALFDRTAMVEMDYRPWGYAWVFPKNGGLSIGMVLPPGQAGLLKERVAAYLSRLGLEGAEVASARGHRILSRRGGEPVVSGHVLLAGDAAGLADEFTQEGIFYAIQSGRLAGREVLRAAGCEGSLASYQAAIDTDLGAELEAARVLGYVSYGLLRRAHRLTGLVASRLDPLWSAFFAVQRGQSTYRRELELVPFFPGLARRRLYRR